MQTIFGSASISGLAARVMAAAALAFAVTSLASLAVEPARADVISVFTVSAEFRGPFQLSGTFTLDSTTGDVTASNLSLSTIAVTRITEVVSTEPGEPNPATTRFKGQNNSNTASLVLVFPVVNLVGYQGGDLSTLSFFLPPSNDELPLFNGTATLASLEAVPEPSTWAMLLAGLGGLALFRFRTARRRSPSL